MVRAQTCGIKRGEVTENPHVNPPYAKQPENQPTPKQQHAELNDRRRKETGLDRRPERPDRSREKASGRGEGAGGSGGRGTSGVGKDGGGGESEGGGGAESSGGGGEEKGGGRSEEDSGGREEKSGVGSDAVSDAGGRRSTLGSAPHAGSRVAGPASGAFDGRGGTMLGMRVAGERVRVERAQKASQKRPNENKKQAN